MKGVAWIELHQQLPTHPKTKRLTRALGLEVPKDIPQVVGHLCMFWLWCLEYAIDGSLERMTAQDIADAAGWYGDAEQFMRAMVDERFIDTRDGGFIVHDWDDYIGRLIEYRAKERRRNAEKQRRHRERVKQQKAEAKLQETQQSAEEPSAKWGDESFGVDPEWLRVIRCYEENIGRAPCGTSGEILASYYDDLGADIVCTAIKATNQAAPDNPWRYLNAILNKWLEQGVDTVEKAEALSKDLERRISNAKKRRENKNGANEPPAIQGDFY